MTDKELLSLIRNQANTLAANIADAKKRGYIVQWTAFNDNGDVLGFTINKLVPIDIDVEERKH